VNEVGTHFGRINGSMPESPQAIRAPRASVGLHDSCDLRGVLVDPK
jgi:hypothetical protein